MILVRTLKMQTMLVPQKCEPFVAMLFAYGPIPSQPPPNQSAALNNHKIINVEISPKELCVSNPVRVFECCLKSRLLVLAELSFQHPSCKLQNLNSPS